MFTLQIWHFLNLTFCTISQELACGNVQVESTYWNGETTISCDLPAGGSGLVELVVSVLGVPTGPVSLAFMSEHAPQIDSVTCGGGDCLAASGADVTVSVQVRAVCCLVFWGQWRWFAGGVVCDDSRSCVIVGGDGLTARVCLRTPPHNNIDAVCGAVAGHRVRVGARHDVLEGAAMLPGHMDGHAGGVSALGPEGAAERCGDGGGGGQ